MLERGPEQISQHSKGECDDEQIGALCSFFNADDGYLRGTEVHVLSP